MLRVDVYVETRAEIEFEPHKCPGQEIKDMLSLPRFDPEGWGATDRWWYTQEQTQPRPSILDRVLAVKRWYHVILRHFKEH